MPAAVVGNPYNFGNSFHLEMGCQILSNLLCRRACYSDGSTSEGIGMMIARVLVGVGALVRCYIKNSALP